MALGLSLSPASGSTKEILAGNAPPDRLLLTLGIAAWSGVRLIWKKVSSANVGVSVCLMVISLET